MSDVATTSRGTQRFAWLSIAAALATVALKTGAWRLTGSVGLLSDALESTVNLVAALLMLMALRVAAKPADRTHEYGHEKAELFSAGAEGLMIVVAAALIVATAVKRLVHPVELADVGIGLVITVVASGLNLAVATVLARQGRRRHSLALTADAKHLMTDVWTSVGVVVGVLLVALTGWLRLDPLLALGVGVNIVVTGGRLVWRSANDLMDPPLPAAERAAVEAVLARYERRGIEFHALRTRTAGARRFIEVHVLVPGDWTVRAGHELVEAIEGELHSAVGNVSVTTHLEPVGEELSYRDA